MYKDARLYRQHRHIPQWSYKCRGRFHSTAVDILQALDSTAQVLTVKASTIPHNTSVLCVFAARQLEKGRNLGYYYGSLVYSGLHAERSTTKVYGEDMMLVALEVFRAFDNEIIERARDWNVEDHPLWIVLEPFCAMRYINDRRYLPGDKTLESEWTEKPKKKNVEFVQTKFAESRSDFTVLRILRIRALFNIAEDKYLFVHYGSSYDFNVSKL